MVELEFIGLNIIAPALTTLSTALIAYGARTFLSIQKAQVKIIQRLEYQREEIDGIKQDIEQIERMV